VLAEDSRRESSSNAPNDVETQIGFKKAGAELFASGVNKMTAGMQNDRKIMKSFLSAADERTSKLKKAASQPNWDHTKVGGAYSPMPVLSDVFIQNAQNAKTTPPHPEAQHLAPVMEQIRAAGVARHFNAGIKAATSDANIDAIKQASEDLLKIKG
jgi:hypothetical protein